MTEAIRTAEPEQSLTFYTDGNPSYIAGLHFINSHRDPKDPIQHHKIIGLQNLDKESELYRHFKQIIERLNRTYRYHTRSANGFKSTNGAVSYATLFVTHYNFLRPHMALGYQVPIPRPELQFVKTIQEKMNIYFIFSHLVKRTQALVATNLGRNSQVRPVRTNMRARSRILPVLFCPVGSQCLKKRSPKLRLTLDQKDCN